jgi:hypothetical protein
MTKAQEILRVSILIIFFLVVTGSALAAPLPPIVVVNHETRECGTIFAGDECTDCFPPHGWEVLGVASDVECPTGYSPVETVDITCHPFKQEFCCTEGHSGVPGDCQDLVVNKRAKQCAFVEDIENCGLPKRWQRRPEDLEPYDWVCPYDYQWIDRLDCLEEGANGEAETSPIPCLGAMLTGPALMALWLVAKRNQ